MLNVYYIFANIDILASIKKINVFINYMNISDDFLENISQNIEKFVPYPYIKYQYSEDEIKKFFALIKDKKGYTIIDDKKYYPIPNYKGSLEQSFNGKNLTLVMNNDYYHKIKWLSDYFQEPVRIKCANINVGKSPYEYYKDPEQNKEWIRKIYPQIKSKVKIPNKELRHILYVKSCGTFPPMIAHYLYDKFKPKTILDMSSGWGDRLIGAIAYGPELYVGVDPNSNLISGYQSIIKTFSKHPERYIMINDAFEDADIPDIGYDLMFSSPPFFVTERYSLDEKQSYMRYGNDVDNWVSGFLLPSIKKVWSLLNPEGYLILFLMNYPINNTIHYYLEKVEDYIKQLSNSHYVGMIRFSSQRGLDDPRPLWIWQKIN